MHKALFFKDRTFTIRPTSELETKRAARVLHSMRERMEQHLRQVNVQPELLEETYQVFEELIQNAIDHTQVKLKTCGLPKLVISVQIAALNTNHVVVVIENQAEPMPPEIFLQRPKPKTMQEILCAEHRVGDSSKRRGGMGLQIIMALCTSFEVFHVYEDEILKKVYPKLEIDFSSDKNFLSNRVVAELKRD